MRKKQQKKVLSVALVGIFVFFTVLWGMDTHPVHQKMTRFEHIRNTLRYSLDNQLALVLPQDEKAFSLSVPYYDQESPLTCEVSALRTALTYLGVSVSEERLLSKLAFATPEQMITPNIWGDPEVGFVGRVDGSIFHRTGYGVFDEPIRDLAREYREADIIEDANLTKVLEEVKDGNPVVAWGLLSQRPAVYWKTLEGKTVEARPGEHARVVIGYTGEINDPEKIILIDPIYGLIRMGADKFVEDWRIMDKRAVVVYKEPRS